MKIYLPESSRKLKYTFRQYFPEEMFTKNADSAVFCAVCRCLKLPSLPPGSILAADADSVKEIGENPGVDIWTCGLSGEDTLTFSSRRESDAVAALMCTVRLPAGVAEPMEIPFSFAPGTDDFTVLSLAAAMLVFERLEAALRDGRILLR